MASLGEIEKWEYVVEVTYTNGQVIEIASPSEEWAKKLLETIHQGIKLWNEGHSSGYFIGDGAWMIYLDGIRVVQVHRRGQRGIIGFSTSPTA